MTTPPDPAARLRQRALQFLVHSFLYYRLGEPVISDGQFDRIAEDLRRLRSEHPDAPLPHQSIVEDALGPEGSGFRIREYPAPIISTAFKLLYDSEKPAVDFREFVERRGYRLEVARAEGG